ncbi:MAG: hypothetical protein JNJ75_09045 [Cyclobacteriaceae bacterium]|nr:hypothetical protein [Cyclobacteriaceae bacterium]
MAAVRIAKEKIMLILKAHAMLLILCVNFLSAHGQNAQVPCADPQVVVQSKNAGGVTEVKSVYLSSIDKSLFRYWNKSKDPVAEKVFKIQSQLNAKGKGKITYVVSPTDCEVQTDKACGTVPQPSAPSSVNACAGVQFTISAGPAYPGTTCRWYNASNVFLVQGTSYSATVFSSTNFKVTSYNPVDGCESAKKTIPVNVTASPSQWAVTTVNAATGQSDVNGKYCTGVASSWPSIVLDGFEVGVTYQVHYNNSPTGSLPITRNLLSDPVPSWNGASLSALGPGGPGVQWVIKTTGTCPKTMYNSVTISPYGAVNTYTVQSTGSNCGEGIVALAGTVGGTTGGEPGVSYQLKLNGTAFGEPLEYNAQTATPVTWGGLPSGTYTVQATRIDCPSISSTFPSSAVLSVSPDFEPVITGAELICNGEVNQELVASPETGVTYQWWINGVLQSVTTKNIPITVAGTYKVKVTSGACSKYDEHDVIVSQPPAAITGVNGLTTSFPNEATVIEVLGSADATNFKYEWNGLELPVADLDGNVEGRRVKLSLPNVGDNQQVTIKPYNLGCVGPSYVFNYTVKNPADAKQTLTFLHPQLSDPNQRSGYLFLADHSINNYAGCIDQLGPVTVNLMFDFGDDYNLGKQPGMSVAASVTVTAVSDLPATNQVWTVPFTLNDTGPEQLFTKKITLNPALVKYILVQVTSYTNAYAATYSSIRLRASFAEENTIYGLGKTALPVSPANGASIGGSWDQTFTWTSCNNVPGYVFQLLRSYSESTTEPSDWSQALTIETESANQSLSVAMAEGSGVYWWRVIPIGNQPGGVGNPANWAPGPYTASRFIYDHPEKDKNWIYSRTFTEGNKLSEQVTYANRLLQVAQQQTKIQDNSQIIATQTMQDYVGRSALSSLPIPTGTTAFGYLGTLLKRDATNPLLVFDFDDDAKISAPTMAQDYSGYYSGTANALNAGVASAEGYPFTRTRFASDGRVREQSGVGLKHSLAGGKTVETHYSSPTEGELVRIFGAEAPDIKSVEKITTIDANGIASVRFQRKDGTVIATAMEVGDSPGPFTQLPSGAAALAGVYEEVKGFERVDEKTIVTRKPLFFIKSTSISIDYEITPSLLNEMCAASNNNQLVGYYTFNNNSNDQSGRYNNATRGGTTTLTADAFGNQSAYVTNGSSGYMQVLDGPDNDFGRDDFTVAIWVKRTSNTISWDNSAAIGKWNSMGLPGTNEWALYFTSNGSDNIPTFYIESGSTTYKALASTPLSLATWYHLTGVRKGNQLLIYINGILSGSTTIPANTVINSTTGLNVWISRYINNYTAATFDDVQIYRRALSADEILSLQSRGTACKTCDYKIQLLLYTEGIQAAQNLATYDISAGACTDQLLKKWDPTVITVPLSGKTKYVLEKRISIENSDVNGLYIDAHVAEVESSYRSLLTANPVLANVTSKVGSGQLQQLKTDLAPYYNAPLQQYLVPTGIAGGCSDVIAIPEFEVCPSESETFDSNCKRNGSESFWDYFYNYYDLANVYQMPHTDVLQFYRTLTGDYNDQKFLYFNNQLTGQKEYFTQATFDAMMVNMITDNGLTCVDVWREWKNQVHSYLANMKQNLDFTPVDMDGEEAEYLDNTLTLSPVVAQKYSLFESMLKAIDGTLQFNMTPPVTEGQETCDPLHPTFIKRDLLYGHFKQTAGATSLDVVPDLLYAYKLVYYNDGSEQQNRELKFYNGGYTTDQINSNAIIPSKQDFTSMNLCDKFKFYSNTLMGVTPISETKIQEFIGKIRTKCESGCERRRGEFRQRVIQNLMEQNGSTLIQYYRTYVDPVMDGNPGQIGVQPAWVGVYDVTANATSYTIAQCEFDALVAALVQNCADYCNTPLTPHDENYPNKPFKVRVFGTAAERLRLTQALTYDFELNVGNSAQTCSSGWDRLDVNYIKRGRVPQISILDGFTFGAISGAPSIPANFANTFTVTNTLDDTNTGSLRWALTAANAIGGSSPVLINFNIPGDGPHRIVVNSSLPSVRAYTTIDATTQPSSVVTSQPKIIIDKTFLANLLTIGYYDVVKGFQFDALGGSVISVGDYCQVIGNVFNIRSFYNAIISVGYSGGNTFDSKIKGNVINSEAPQAGAIGIVVWSPTRTDIGGDNSNDGNVFRYCRLQLNTSTNSVFSAKIKNNRFLSYGCTSSACDGIQISKTIPGGGIAPYPNYEMKSNLFDYQFSTLPQEGLITTFGLQNYACTITGSTITGSTMSFTGTATANTTVELFLGTGESNGQQKIRLLKSLGFASVGANGLWTISGLPVMPAGYQFFCTVTKETYNSGGNIYNSTTSAFTAYTIPVTCNIAKSICFHFTNPFSEVTIPPGLEDIVYDPVKIPCTQLAANYLTEAVEQQKEQIIKSHGDNFRREYYKQCGDPSLLQDKLKLYYNSVLHQYTLYYYDRAGNLIRTVPPEGVATLAVTEAAIGTNRSAMPPHLQVTEYQYNSLGQLTAEHTPDGTPKPNNLVDRPASTLSPQDLNSNTYTYYSAFVYNSKGQLRFSRNALQKENDDYSYTKYDDLGRVIEVGQAEPTAYDYNTLYANRDFTGYNAYPTADIKQVNRTYYTSALNAVIEFAGIQLPIDPRTSSTLPVEERRYKQRNLRNRISFTVLDEDGTIATTADNVLTVYSYDPHGNVEWVAQVLPGLDIRVTVYTYDLISGKVTQVSYSPGNADQFFHKYEYDGSNRIKSVFTSADGELWHKDAAYDYYLHGPLKRSVIGEDKVQGLDYTYTVHGWLKAINHPLLATIANDPGQDGSSSSVVGRDVYGMALGYYTGDYVRTGSTLTTGVVPIAPLTKDLYNGNISAWSNNTGEWASGFSSDYPLLTTQFSKYLVPTAYVLTYDELNRLLTGILHVGTNFATATNNFKVTYGYTTALSTTSALTKATNGNIYTANTTGYTGVSIDALTYVYPTYQNPVTNRIGLLSNRLRHVTEASPANTLTLDDVEPGQVVDNYSYDAIGNLTRDLQQKRAIRWTPYGKVKKVIVLDASNNETPAYTEFVYDAAGNRVIKKQVNALGTVTALSYYVRDGSGNVMAVHKLNTNTGLLETSEIPVYGSDRLGIYIKKESSTGLFTAPANGIYTRLLDNRRYEVKDHLGNVRATITDRKIGTASAFRPSITGLYNYYPFGMSHPERNYKNDSDTYRYGFNGKEKDSNTEWGDASLYDYGFRIYNPGLGRFLSVDPLTKKYPMLTPYQFASNRPIDGIDIDGLEWGGMVLPRPVWEPLLTLPRLTIPVPPGPFPAPPVLPLPPIDIPSTGPAPPQYPATPKVNADEFDWSKYNETDVSTWPKPPPLEGQGELKEGEPSNEKARKLGQKRLFDEKGREYRPHKPDKYHPKGHYDVKEPGKMGAWKNYTPDGQLIPKGRIWGVDWEPGFILMPFFTPEQNYEFNMEIYRRKLEKYQKDLEEYEKKEKEYWDSIPDYLKG